MKKVALLFGGSSTEHDVSIKSAKSIFEHIDKRKYEVVPVYIDRQNEFYQSVDCSIILTEPITNVVKFLKSFDIVFPIVHGNYGEDGKLQGLLDFFNIKYVGAKTLGSAVCMDKAISKIIFEYLGIPVIPYTVITKKYKISDIEELEYPLIVKPANGGSSIGINKAENRKELKKALKEAFKYDSKVIVEQFIVAQELECAVLEGKKLYTSQVGEIITNNCFYDYDAKYNQPTETLLKAKIPKNIAKLIQMYAKCAFVNTGCCGMARIDFFYDGTQVYINEINTLPGFTEISMYPKLLEESLSYQELITFIIESALNL